MDDAQFKALYEKAGGKLPPTDDEQVQAVDEALTADPELNPQAAEGGEERRPDGTSFSEPPAQEPGLGDASGLDAIAGGALKSVFETKDFLFGDTPVERQTEFRQNVEEAVELRQEQSMIDGFSAEVAQFATAMIGLGKLRMAAKALPWVGRGLGSIEATRKGRVSVEAGQAALAGAMAFDPHEERLSNLIQTTPLANPLNGWLAADPEDSEAEGRLKAAFESIGMDAVLVGTFMSAGRIWKHLRKGETEKAAREAEKVEQEAQGAIDAEEAPRPAEEPQEPVQAAPDEGAPEAMPETDASPEARTADTEALAAADEDIDVSVTSSPTEAAREAGAELPGRSARAAIELSDEVSSAVFEGLEADMRALATHGEWTAAIEHGHTFGRGSGIPYQKLNNVGELNHFVDRIVDVSAERLETVKGGAVLTDKRLMKNVEDLTKLYNVDPAVFMGVIQKAGKDATQLAARMEATYLVANRMFQDAYALALRNSMGDFTQFGSKAAAEDALRQRLSLAASVYGSAKAMSSNAGRALRMMRSEFAIDQDMVSNMGTMDQDMLRDLVLGTGGDPRKLTKLSNPSMYTKMVDFLQYLYINNLVSGPKTQLVNLLSNSYMLGVRPMERIIGGTLTGNLKTVKEALKQYTYMGQSFRDGFALGVKAFVHNDSYLTPHKSELYVANRLGEASGAVQKGLKPQFKPWTSISNVAGNALQAATTAVGVPTRTLGMVDEIMKQTTYRSKVLAGAYYDGMEKGVQGRLKGKQLQSFVDQHVRDTLDNAFDAEGRGTIPGSLHEANTATFQQDLLPETWGKSFQNIVTKHPEARILLPFIKTPTNVIRYGWKMTPGLNVLQTEYRNMLLGKMGAEAQAQAVGQMSMGSMWVGAAAYMSAQGTITGAGPSDYKASAELRATGWRPYSIVVRNEDGTKTYVNYGRYDPIAIPMGIVADIQDALAATEGQDVDSETEATIGALLLAMASQFRNKTYLLGISQFMDAMADPGTDGERLEKWVGQVTSSFVPYASALRQFNTDPYLRDARSMTDKVLTTVPGMSDEVPARYDAWGDPVRGRKGLWATDTNDLVDHETQRLALTGYSTPNKPTPYHSGVDFRDLVLSDGRNAYAAYQELSGHLPGAPPLKTLVRRLMQTEAYKRAPDGDITTRGTKMWMLHGPISRYREGALRILKADPVVRDAMLKDQMKVIEHYSTFNGKRQAAQPQQSSPPDLEDVGKAFGVDLDALLGPAEAQ